MVPMLTCGLVRSNFALATVGSSWLLLLDSYVELVCAAEGPVRTLLAADLLDDLVGDVRGTSAYESNSIEYDAWPEVLDLRSPTYPNISDSGTRALTTMSP